MVKGGGGRADKRGGEEASRPQAARERGRTAGLRPRAPPGTCHRQPSAPQDAITIAKPATAVRATAAPPLASTPPQLLKSSSLPPESPAAVRLSAIAPSICGSSYSLIAALFAKWPPLLSLPLPSTVHLTTSNHIPLSRLKSATQLAQRVRRSQACPILSLPSLTRSRLTKFRFPTSGIGSSERHLVNLAGLPDSRLSM